MSGTVTPSPPGPWLQNMRKGPGHLIYLPGDSRITPQEAINKYNLPKGIVRNPHSCGCNHATLQSITGPQPDGYIYADYQCSSRWSNIFRFPVMKIENDRKVTINANGDLVDNKTPFVAPGAEVANNANN